MITAASRLGLRVAPVGQGSTQTIIPVLYALGQANPAAPVVAPPAAFCPSLPSSESAYELVSGQPSGLVNVARDLLVRGALVGAGVWVGRRLVGRPVAAGEALQLGLFGSVGIEAFVLLYMLATAPRR